MEDDKFNQMYEEYGKGLLGYLIKLTGSRETGQDLLQELFITLYKKYDHLHILHEKSYLFTMAYRLYVKWLGQEKKSRPVTADLEQAADQRRGFEEDIQWKLLREDILQELRRADPVLEHIFILRVDNGFKIKEITAIVGKSERSINRYVAKMATLIEQRFGSTFDDYISRGNS